MRIVLWTDHELAREMCELKRRALPKPAHTNPNSGASVLVFVHSRADASNQATTIVRERMEEVWLVLLFAFRVNQSPIIRGTKDAKKHME